MLKHKMSGIIDGEEHDPPVTPRQQILSCVRKSSNSDLQSRLKTRKLLGLGGNNGQIYFSKIGQFFGFEHDEVTRKQSNFMTAWLMFSSSSIAAQGIMSVILPAFSFRLETGGSLLIEAQSNLSISHRLYGVALISYGVYCSGCCINGGNNISHCLASNALLCSLQFLALAPWSFESYSIASIVLHSFRVVSIVINISLLPASQSIITQGWRKINHLFSANDTQINFSDKDK